MNRPSWKKTLSIITICVLLFQSCAIRSVPNYIEIENTGNLYCDEFGAQTIDAGQIAQLPSHPYCGIDNNYDFFYWQDGKRYYLAEDVYSAAPILSGYAYLNNDGLYFYDYSETKRICVNTEAFCSDGNNILYFDNSDCTVYAYDGVKRNALFVVHDCEIVLSMISNAKWIVLFTDKGTMIFDRSKNDYYDLNDGFFNLKYNCDPNTSFLWNNCIIEIGWAQYGGTVYDLESERVSDLNIGYDLRDCITTISCLYKDQTIYLSVHSLQNPKQGDTVWEKTISIDCASMSATEIIAKYYQNLLCDQEHVYGSTIQHAVIIK